MAKANDQVERVEETHNGLTTVSFKVIEGGKPPTNPNWLVELEPGSVFVCRSKQMSTSIHSLEQYHVLFQIGKCTGLFHNLNDLDLLEPVDNLRFSQNMELIEILGNSRNKKEEKNGEDHQRTPGTV